MTQQREHREPPSQSGRRKLSGQEVGAFFQQRPDLFENVADDALRMQRIRMVELFAGGFGLIRSQIPLPPQEPNIISARILPVRQDVQELSQVFGQNMEPLFAQNKGALTIGGHLVGLDATNLVTAVNGERVTEADLAVSEDITTGGHNTLLDSLVKATALDRNAIRSLARDIFALRTTQASPEVEEEVEEIVVPSPASEPVIPQVDRQTVGNRLRQGLENEVFDVREHQYDMLSAITEGIENGMGRMGIFAATGSGKTRVMREFARVADVPTLIVVPTQIILQQTVEEMESAGLRVGSYYSRSKDTFAGDSAARKQVIVTTYDSFSHDNFAIRSQDVGALIFDEAHKTLGRKTFRKMSEFDHSLQLAFTASPDYSPQRTIRGMFPPVYERNAAEYARNGVLAPFSVWIARTRLDLTTVSIEGGGEYNEIKLADAVEKAGISDVAAELYKQRFARDGKSAIAYCVGITHARNTAEKFNKNGIAAAYISGETPYEERAEILGKFKSGEIKVLCNAELLTVGFDEPRAEVALNLRPTRSIVTAVQRAGRVLRQDPNNPQKTATIVDFMPEKFISTRPPISYAEVVGTARAFPGEGEEAVQEQPSPRRGSRKTTTQPAVSSFTLQHGTVVVSSIEEVMRIGEGFTEYDVAHPGEMNMWQLSQHLHLPVETVARRIPSLLRRYLQEHEAEHLQPESVVKQRKTQNGVRTHYTGEFVTYIEQALAQAKVTGRTVKDFTDRYHITDASVYAALRGFPEWARQHNINPDPWETVDVSAVGRSNRQLTQAAWQYMLEKGGYETRLHLEESDPRRNVREMMRDFDVAKTTIEKALADIHQELYGNPRFQDYAQEGQRGTTMPGLFFSEDIVERVRKKVGAVIKIEENDPRRSVQELAEDWHVDRKVVMRAFQRVYRDRFDSMGVTSKRPSDKTRPPKRYTPEEFEAVRKELGI